MHRFFCFLSCFVGLAVSSSAYGNWPKPKKFIEHLLKPSGLYATFKAAFEAVFKEAEPSGFKNLQLFGEKSGALEPWKEFDLKEYDYNVLKKNRGFFSCMVGLTNILNIENIEEAVEKNFSEDRCIDRKFMPAVTKICRVLLSEDFARKLLTDLFVDEFLASAKEADFSYCSVNFYSVWYSEHDLNFSLEYVQLPLPIRLEFQVNFNVEKCCLEENGEVDIGRFEIQGCFIHSNELCLSQGDLATALDGPDEDIRIAVQGVDMKAMRMMTKNANMGDKKSTENPQTEQAHNTQSFLSALNTSQTVTKVTTVNGMPTPMKTAKAQIAMEVQKMGFHFPPKAKKQLEYKETQTEKEVWERSDTISIFFSYSPAPTPNASKSPKEKEQTGGKEEEQKETVQPGDGKKINVKKASQQQGQGKYKKKGKRRNKK